MNYNSLHYRLSPDLAGLGRVSLMCLLALLGGLGWIVTSLNKPFQLAPAPATQLQQVVHLRGTLALLPLAQRVADAYMDKYPNRRVVVSTSGSLRAFRSLQDASTDVAMISGATPSKDDEFNSVTVGHERVSVLVHPENPVNNLTLVQLRHIFTGRIFSWVEAGGNNVFIEPLVGPAQPDLPNLWRDLLLQEGESWLPGGIETNEAMRIYKVSKNRGAIALVSANLPLAGAKRLQIEGVGPDQAGYPLNFPLRLLSAKKPGLATLTFVNFFVRRAPDFNCPHNKLLPECRGGHNE